MPTRHINTAVAECLRMGENDWLDTWLFERTTETAQTLEPFNRMRLAIFGNALKELSSDSEKKRKEANDYMIGICK